MDVMGCQVNDFPPAPTPTNYVAPATTTLNFGVLKSGAALPITKQIQITNSGSSPVTLAVAVATGTAAAGGKYVIVAGDSLTKIAQKAYGSATPANIDRIYQANKAKIGPDPDDLKVGMELVIPAAH